MENTGYFKMIDWLRRGRIGWLIPGLLAWGLIVCALVLQYVLHEEPCPLCIFQRVAVMGLGLEFSVLAVLNPRTWGRLLGRVLVCLTSGVGALIAARHIWLQHLPADEVPECGPGLNYLLDNFPFSHVLSLVLRGSGECAQKGWTLLHLSIPEWTFLWFVMFAIWVLAVRQNKH